MNNFRKGLFLGAVIIVALTAGPSLAQEPAPTGSPGSTTTTDQDMGHEKHMKSTKHGKKKKMHHKGKSSESRTGVGGGGSESNSNTESNVDHKE